MPAYNITFEDFSPTIAYSPDWRSGSSAGDPLGFSYSTSSFTLTNTLGGTASFAFNGTGVTIFGAKRPNHGAYQTTLDNQSFPDNGDSTNPVFQVPLFSSQALKQGSHSVKLINEAASSFLDIDFITIQTSVGEEDENLIVDTFQDTDTAFSYSPANDWSKDPPEIGTFLGSSGHVTTSTGALMTFTFQVASWFCPLRSSSHNETSNSGDAVFLYGPVGPSISPFDITIDGGASVTLNATKTFYRPQALLYFATNLGPQQHVLRAACAAESQSGQMLAIDFATVYSSPSFQSAIDAASASSNGGSITFSGGVIAGIVVSVVFALLFIGGTIFFCRRRRRENRGRSWLPTSGILQRQQKDEHNPPSGDLLQRQPSYYPSIVDRDVYRAAVARGTNRVSRALGRSQFGTISSTAASSSTGYGSHYSRVATHTRTESTVSLFKPPNERDSGEAEWQTLMQARSERGETRPPGLPLVDGGHEPPDYYAQATEPHTAMF